MKDEITVVKLGGTEGVDFSAICADAVGGGEAVINLALRRFLYDKQFCRTGFPFGCEPPRIFGG